MNDFPPSNETLKSWPQKVIIFTAVRRSSVNENVKEVRANDLLNRSHKITLHFAFANVRISFFLNVNPKNKLFYIPFEKYLSNKNDFHF